MVTIKTVALRANVSKVMPALVCLSAVLTVLSDFLVKIVFCLLNMFFAVAPMVCLQRYDSAEQAAAQ